MTETTAQPPRIAIEGPWSNLFEAAARRRLENEVLPHFLPRRRWFGSKARVIEGVRLVEWSAVRDDPGRFWFTFVEVRFTSGPIDLYFLPLAIHAADGRRDGPPPNALARVATPIGEAWLVDAATESEFASAILSAIESGASWPMERGTIDAERTTAFESLREDASEAPAPHPGPGSSSNTLIFLGERLLLKVFRRIEAGINPDLEVGRFLTERTNFTRTPQVAGSVSRRDDQGGEATLAILQQCVPHQGDGWTHALEELRHYFERALAHAALPEEGSQADVVALARSDSPAAIAELMGESLDSADVLGRRTGELHFALASRDDIPEFAPEPLGEEDIDGMNEDLRAQAERALADLRRHRDRMPPSQHDRIDWLLEEGPTRLTVVTAGRYSPPEVLKIRIHGDYHLGQVIRVRDDYVLLDFEGEPARSIDERRGKYSPIRDLAGMLRSFHYAAGAGAFAVAESRGFELARIADWAGLWQRHVGAAFLRGYLRVAGTERFLPRSDEDLTRLLDGFMLGKAFYELAYELNNRPDWARIPLGGVVGLLGGSSRL